MDETTNLGEVNNPQVPLVSDTPSSSFWLLMLPGEDLNPSSSLPAPPYDSQSSALWFLICMDHFSMEFRISSIFTPSLGVSQEDWPERLSW